MLINAMVDLPLEVEEGVDLAEAGDVVAEALDREKGADLRDPGVFRAHAARYEKEVRGGDGGACL